MWEAIKKNRRRSTLLISLMGAILVGMGFLISLFVDPHGGGLVGVLIALAIWFGLYFLALFQGDQLLLLSAGALRIQKDDAPRLWNTVEEMTIAAGLDTMPYVYLIENSTPNAFAVGSTPKKAAIAVTSGLLRRLNRDELQGVVAHEIAHIRNLDTSFLTLASLMLGSIVLLSDVFVRTAWLGGGSRRLFLKRSWWKGKLVLVGAILIAIIAPICARLLYFACSRRREYLADASAARFTRYPDGLASALEKITLHLPQTRQVNRALAPAFIVAPVHNLSSSSWFSTHPPTQLRIKILRSMGGGAGYVDYEAAFRKLQRSQRRSDKRQCIGSRTLRSEKSLPAREPTAESNPKQGTVERIRDVADLVDRLANFLPIACGCGVSIKVPPNLKRESVACTRCGREHTVPRAHAVSHAEAQPGTSSFGYERTGKGWEAFRCSCEQVIQLSPSFNASSIRCPGCKRQVDITSPREASHQPASPLSAAGVS